MKLVCYNDWHQLPESANTLFEHAAKDNIFVSREWFECLTTKALDNDQSLLLACVLSNNKVLAILPLIENAENKTWYSLRHGFTPLYKLLVIESAEYDHDHILSFLAQALSQLSIKGLLLEPVAADSSVSNGLQAHLTDAGYNCKYIFRHYNWVYRLNGQSFADYMAERPARLRNTIARKRRKLDREQGFEIRLFKGHDVPINMSDYYQVYHASWKQNEITNAGFQDCIIDKFSKAGWSRLAILYVNKQAIAAQLWFVHNHKASIFRLAYDKAWRAYSTGSILTSHMMEHVIDDEGVNEIDFLTGNDAYKQDWMSERRERFLLSCVNSIMTKKSHGRIFSKLEYILKKR